MARTRLGRVEYLRWAKSLPPCRYRLCDSGVPDVAPDEFPLETARLRLDVQNPYGLPELIESLAARYSISEDHVLPLAGTSGANFVAMAAVLEPGDPVIIEAPAYEPLLRAAEFLGARVLQARRDPARGFRFDLDQVVDLFRSGARAVVISDLHNPSGMRCAPDDLLTLARLTAEVGAVLLVDEVYLEYAAVNRGETVRPAARLGDHVITTNSLTKVYGLGRLRAGWMLAAPAIIEKARDVLDHVCVVNSVPSEQLACEALRRIGELEQRTRRLYQSGRRLFAEWLASRDDVVCPGNDGAVFEFPRIRGMTDTRPLCDLLAREYDTRVVPGAFFGAPEHMRISFCRPPELVAEGLARLGTALDRLRDRA